MAHEWHSGVLTSSSWHGLEDIGIMSSADDMIAHGLRVKAWPTSVGLEEMVTSSGLKVPGMGVVCQYQDAQAVCHAAVGDRYRPNMVSGWYDMVRAAVLAGARPTGAFALRGGARILGTFEVGESNGIKNHLLLVDDFTGALKLTVGTSSTRTVCANTLRVALRNDGVGMQTLRHTASLETKVKILSESIGEAIKNGENLRDTYHAAEAATLNKPQALAVLDLLFPSPPADLKGREATIMADARADAVRAMQLPINNAGPTVATIWNAATYLIDRDVRGHAKDTKAVASNGRLDSMIFGTRANRVNEIYNVIETVLTDGTIERMTATEALSHGIEPAVVGAKLLESMLE